MDWQTLTQFLSTVGFPIVCALALAWYVKHLTDNHTKEINELNKQHHEEVTAMREEHKRESVEFIKAIDNNTLAITVLTEHLKEGKEENG